MPLRQPPAGFAYLSLLAVRGRVHAVAGLAAVAHVFYSAADRLAASRWLTVHG